MCFDPLATPPVEAADPPAPITVGSVARGDAAVRTITALVGSSYAAIILPDGRGLHPYYERLAQRLAEHGVDAVALDHFIAGSNDPASSGPRPKFTWTEARASIAKVADALRSDDPDRRVVVVGFCLGGRLAFLAASEPGLEIDAVVGLYGLPAGPSNHDLEAPVDLAAQVVRPILGLFGGADELVPAEAVASYEAALLNAGAEHTFVTYPGAPHSFFDRRSDEFAAESADVWARLLSFIKETP